MDIPVNPTYEGPVCPVPLRHQDQIVLGHGSGGRLTHELIQDVFLSSLHSQALQAGNDFGVVSFPEASQHGGRLVVSTDSHIVNPLFFPGGDIGRLAICGTVNDVSMSGAIPRYLTVSFIIEEGFSIGLLRKVLESMQIAAIESGIQVVAGDTKVVEKGKGDGLFISTAGIGCLPDGRQIGGEQAKPGDVVLVSGTLGDHGIAVLAARGELGFETEIMSDVSPLNHMIQDMLKVAPHTHVLRDPTRGGLATTLNEIAKQSNVCIWVEESFIPVNPAVHAACEMLGFDPLFIANEGKLIVIVPAEEASQALASLKKNVYGQNAVRIGEVRSDPKSRVLLHTMIGGTRILDMLAGEMLPRIC